MRCYEPGGSDRRAEFKIKVNDGISDEWEPYQDKDGALCCHIAVKAGDQITVQGTFEGITTHLRVDLALDGVIRNYSDNIYKTSVKRHKKTISFSDGYVDDSKDKLLYKSKIGVEKLNRACSHSSEGGFGTIEVQVYVLRRLGELCDAPETRFDNLDDLTAAGPATYQSNVKPTHEIKLDEGGNESEEVAKSMRTRLIKKAKEKRPAILEMAGSDISNDQRFAVKAKPIPSSELEPDSEESGSGSEASADDTTSVTNEPPTPAKRAKTSSSPSKPASSLVAVMIPGTEKRKREQKEAKEEHGSLSKGSQPATNKSLKKPPSSTKRLEDELFPEHETPANKSIKQANLENSAPAHLEAGRATSVHSTDEGRIASSMTETVELNQRQLDEVDGGSSLQSKKSNAISMASDAPHQHSSPIGLNPFATLLKESSNRKGPAIPISPLFNLTLVDSSPGKVPMTPTENVPSKAFDDSKLAESKADSSNEGKLAVGAVREVSIDATPVTEPSTPTQATAAPAGTLKRAVSVSSTSVDGKRRKMTPQALKVQNAILERKKQIAEQKARAEEAKRQAEEAAKALADAEAKADEDAKAYEEQLNAELAELENEYREELEAEKREVERRLGLEIDLKALEGSEGGENEGL